MLPRPLDSAHSLLHSRDVRRPLAAKLKITAWATFLCTAIATLPTNDLTDLLSAIQLTPVKKFLREDFHTVKIFRASMPNSHYISAYSGVANPAPADAASVSFHCIAIPVRGRGPVMVC
jgi:hypothetical protein